MNAILQVENLTKQYADFKLDHVSFSVPKGTIMGLIGENGAGKSTTINAIALCNPQDSQSTNPYAGRSYRTPSKGNAAGRHYFPAAGKCGSE